MTKITEILSYVEIQKLLTVALEKYNLLNCNIIFYIDDLKFEFIKNEGELTSFCINPDSEQFLYTLLYELNWFSRKKFEEKQRKAEKNIIDIYNYLIKEEKNDNKN